MSTPVNMVKVYGTDLTGNHYCLSVVADALGYSTACDTNTDPTKCPHYRAAVREGTAMAERLAAMRSHPADNSPEQVDAFDRRCQRKLAERFDGCCAPTRAVAWAHAFGSSPVPLTQTLAAAIDGWAKTAGVLITGVQAYGLAIAIADELGA